MHRQDLGRCWLATWLALCFLLNLSFPTCTARLLAEHQAQSAAGRSALDNLVVPEPTTQWQGGASCKHNPTVVQVDAVVRLTGAALIPFTTQAQETGIQAIRESLLAAVGPLELTSFREFYPDPTTPDNIRELHPGVDVSITMWYLVSNSTGNWQTIAYESFVEWGSRVGPGGAQAISTTPPRLVHSFLNRSPCPESYVLQPLVALFLTLAATPHGIGKGTDNPLLIEQVSAAAEPLSAIVVSRRLGSLVEVVGTAQGERGATLVHLEVTLYQCRGNAAMASPDCERQVLAETLKSSELQQQWTLAGFESVTVVEIKLRQPPAPPIIDLEAHAQQKAWTPWHLDRLDQRTLPLDGTFSANACGSGVNVYIVSAGVRGDHAEFKFMGGNPPGTRVQAGWGFKGLDPLQDSPDSGTFYGLGTYAASLCCGINVGLAKNATIHSVRFHEGFLLQPSFWSEGGLPAALDFVLSTYKLPAVVLLDTLWEPGRVPGSESATTSAIQSRLDKLQKSNLTVVAPVLGKNPCQNILVSHPGVIAVAGTDVFDQVMAFGPRDASCIDMWAPSGGVGIGMVGAEPSGPTNYTRVITKGYGAAGLVTGLAAQFLQLYPDATGSEVRRALLESASNHTVTGAGISPTLLAFTNLTQASAAVPPAASSDKGAALSFGAYAGVIVGAMVTVLGVAGAIFFVYNRGRYRGGNRGGNGAPEEPGWQIHLADIEFEKQADGSPYLLGTGQYGPVYKAVKGGVQVVAVKEMNKPEKCTWAALSQEMGMLKAVSRDANIVQFFGACTKDDKLLIIMEYMEGGDLFTALASRGGKLQWFNRGQEVMLDVLRGLVFLHRSGVVHRGISSKNILLGRNGQAKLSGVGLAQLHKQDLPTPLGALPWAAPESLLGAAATEKADMYSLGVVLWELVTCEMPQRGQLRAVEVPRECPQEVADAIRDCMQLHPEARPSAKDLFDRLWNCSVRSSECGTDSSTKVDSESSVVDQLGGSVPGGGPRQPSQSLRTLDPDAFAQQSKSGQLASTLACASAPMEREASGGMVSIAFSRMHFCTNHDGSRQGLGSGAYGTVFLVLLDGVQPLAAKEVQLGTHASIHSTFIKEAEILWRLRHRNIVTLSGISMSEGRGYLLMELMEGGSLFDQLNLRFKQSRERVFGWYRRGAALVLDIARGLHYIHSMGVSHFDIKSHNILLTRELHAKIVDVGLSRVLTCTHHSLDYTAGTFPYMAPELLTGTRCTQSVDIFAMGILIHEICSGEHPVRGYMRPLEVPSDCPVAALELMQDCLHSDPSQRPTARELVERLTAIVCVDSSPPYGRASPEPASGAGGDGTRCEVGGAGRPGQVGQVVTYPLAPAAASPFKAVTGPSLRDWIPVEQRCPSCGVVHAAGQPPVREGCGAQRLGVASPLLAMRAEELPPPC